MSVSVPAPVPIDRAPSEWRHGWTIVMTALAGMYVSCFYIYSFGVFIEPLQQEFGWSRQDISLGLTLCTFVAAGVMPFVGMAVDRFGPRRVVLPGLFLYASSLALLALAGPGIASWWLGWTYAGIAYATVNASVWIYSVARHFTVHRGMAFSITLIGTSACAGTLPIIAAAMIDALGWRGAYMALAGLALLIQVPLVLAFIPAAKPRGPVPADAVPAPVPVSVPDTPAVVHGGLSKAQILRTSRFWKLCIVSVLAVTGLVGLMVHFVPMLSDAGMDRGLAVKIAGAIGLSSLAGRLLGGYFLDRAPGTIIGGVIFSLPIIVCVLLFLDSGSPAVAIVAALLLGLSFGGESDVIAYLSTRYFGLRHYGFGYSIITACMVAGGGLGPWLAAVVFDRTGNYGDFILYLMASFAICAVLVATLGPYPDFDGEEEGA